MLLLLLQNNPIYPGVLCMDDYEEFGMPKVFHCQPIKNGYLECDVIQISEFHYKVNALCIPLYLSLEGWNTFLLFPQNKL